MNSMSWIDREGSWTSHMHV